MRGTPLPGWEKEPVSTVERMQLTLGLVTVGNHRGLTELTGCSSRNAPKSLHRAVCPSAWVGHYIKEVHGDSDGLRSHAKRGAETTERVPPATCRGAMLCRRSQ